MEQEIIYLNNAATSWPKPLSVREAVAGSLLFPFIEEGRTTFSGQKDTCVEARELCAEFFGAKNPDNFVFCAHATDALNMIIHGFAEAQDDHFHVITTDFEHNAVLRPLYDLERKGKISLTIIRSDRGELAPSSVRAAVCEDTRLAVLSHGSNVTGTVTNLQAAGQYLQTQGIFVCVDASQTAGQTAIDLSRLPVDALAFTGHKALYGIPGTGGFWIKDPLSIMPVRQGGAGVDSASKEMSSEMPYRFEAGTPNYPGIAGLAAGIRFCQETGLREITWKTMQMTHDFIGMLAGEENIEIYTPIPRLPLVCLNVEGTDCDELGFILARSHGIITRAGLHCAPLIHEQIDKGKGCLRLSLSYFTTEEECTAAADAIREVAIE